MPRILIRRSNTAGNDAYTGDLGELTLDTQERKLRLHDGVKAGGYIVANMSDIQEVVNRVDGLSIADISGLDTALQTIQADVADHENRLSSVEGNYIHKNGTVPFTGDVDLGGNSLSNVASPNASTDAATKGYVDDEISALGDVFSYEGDITGGTEASPLNVTSLSNTNAGAYYSVSSSGFITDGSTETYVNVGDSIVFDSSGGYRVIDNTNSEVSGTTNFITVSGNPDTGYTVDISTVFKNRVSGLESSSVQGISGSNAIVVNNTDPQNPIIGINNATQSSDGAMSSSDKSKLDGIESGAQVNTVTSVSGRDGDVTLNNSDVGLGNVNNYAVASEAESIAGVTSTKYATPSGVRSFVEDGEYTIDAGTF